MSDETAQPRPKLEVGMVLIENETGTIRVWAVKSAGSKPKVIAHYGSCMAEATLTGSSVPNGWHIVSHDLVAERLADLLPSETP